MRLTIIAVALALAACGSSNIPRLDSTSPDAVTVIYPEGERAAAEKLAADECAKYNNKRSRARSTTDRSNEKLAIFDCVS